MTVKELRKKRAKIVKEIRALANTFNEPDHKATAEENEKWERVNQECDELKRRIHVLERTESLEQERPQPAGDPDVGRGNAYGDECRPHAKQADRPASTRQPATADQPPGRFSAAARAMFPSGLSARGLRNDEFARRSIGGLAGGDGDIIHRPLRVDEVAPDGRPARADLPSNQTGEDGIPTIDSLAQGS